MGKFEPKIGDVVWFVDGLDEIINGTVIEEEVIDAFNGYKIYSIMTDDEETYNYPHYSLFPDKKSLLKVELEALMNSRDYINRQISHLEQELNDN